MAHRPRYYWGDFRLWREGIAHVEEDQAGETEEHHGVYRKAALHVPDSPNWSLGGAVSCLGAPNPNSKDQKGWRATYRALRVALRDRSLVAYPLVWVEDEGTLKAVTSYVAGVLTSAAHGRSNGDVVLIRRAGIGLFSLATVGGATADTFTLTAIAGTTLHAIAAADEILLVEGYWLPMLYKGVGPTPFTGKGDWE